MRTTATRLLPFDQDRLYAILVDIRDHHRRIAHASIERGTYRVIEGGVGPGTVLCVTTRLTGPEPVFFRFHAVGPYAFEMHCDEVPVTHGFHVAATDTGQSLVTMWVEFGHIRGPWRIVHRLLARGFALDLISDKLDDLGRYAATLGVRTHHGHVDEADDHGAPVTDRP